ncbi:unnamed protein product [Heligmosomoides polygyrus]|uniref:Elf-1_N domain-containing protein n=1 Tax=Heligmosomoides polygyrus TaxID=6339 RepID=A0A183GAR5_HELPZ|nr:unnamed protein product [Heligmosomoides polygyrus]
MVLFDSTGMESASQAVWMPAVAADFDLRQLEIDEVEKLEGVEEEDQEFQPEEECVGVTTPLTSVGTITFSKGQIVSEEKIWLY